MPDHPVVFVDDEHVPLTVDAGLAAVEVQSGLEPLGLVADDGVVHEELRVLRRGGLQRDRRQGGPCDLLRLRGGQPGLGRGGGFDHLLDFGEGESGIRLGRGGDRLADGLLDLGCGEPRSGLIRGGGGHLGPHDLLDLGPGQPRAGVVVGAAREGDQQRDAQRRHGRAHSVQVSEALHCSSLLRRGCRGGTAGR